MALSGNGDNFRARRKRMMAAIAPGATAIMPSMPVAVRSGDVEFVYRQDSDFYYLSGFVEWNRWRCFRRGIRTASS